MIKKLKQYMKDNNINQKQLASLMNISEAHMSRLLSGTKKPGEKTVEAYFNLPGVKEKEIIHRTTELVIKYWNNNKIKGEYAKFILAELNPQEGE